MNVVKCSLGHYYDADKFTVCPHCGVVAQEPKQSDSILRTEETVALKAEEIQAWESRPEIIENTVAKSKRPKSILLGKKRKTEMLTGQNEPLYTESIMIKTGTIQQTVQPTMQSSRGCTVGWLVYLNGVDKGKTCELKTGNNFIGSNQNMDIQIKNDTKVAAANHAKIVFEPNRQEFFVAPGDSSELVYRGDDVVMIPQKLSPYDKIVIGDTAMLFVPLCGEKFTW